MENVRARLLSIESPMLRLEDPNFDYSGTNDKQSLLSGTLIASDFVTVEATAGEVPGLDPSFNLTDFLVLGSPFRFELIQAESVVTDNLPSSTQFVGGIGGPPGPLSA